VSNIPHERSALLAEVRDMMLDGGRRAVIGGQSGVGKSTVLDAIVENIRSTSNALVLHSRSERTESATSYHGLRDMLDSIDVAEFDLPNSQRQSLLAALGKIEGVSISVDALNQSVNSILKALSRDRLVVVAIDDIDWLDDETHHLIAYVADRPTGGARTASFIATLTSDPALTGLAPTFDLAACAVEELFSLLPLSRSAFSTVVTGSVRFELDGREVEQLFRRTGGNPLWAFELVYQATPGSPTGNVPKSLAEIARARLETLTASSKQILAVLAVLEDCTRTELMALLEIGVDEIRAALKAEVVQDIAGHLSAVHPVLAGAALDDLGPEQALALHRLIHERTSGTARRASHLDLATPPGPDETVAAQLFQAGQDTRESGTPSDALHLFERSVERTSPESEALAERILAVATQRFSLGDIEGAARAFDRLAFDKMPIAQLDRALPLALMTHSVRDGDAEAERFLANIATAADDALRRAVIEAYRAEGSVETATRRRLASDSLSVLRSAGAAPVTRHRAVGALVAANLDAGLGLDSALLDEARELEGEVDGIALNDSAEGQLALFAYQTDDLAGSRRALEIMARRAREAGEPLMAAVFGIHLSAVQTLSGDPVSAAETLVKWGSLQAFDSPPPALVAAQGQIRLREVDEAPLRELIAQPSRHGSETSAAIVRAALTGMSAARRRRWEEAVFELERARALSQGMGVEEPGRRLWVDFALARTYVALGRTDDATGIVEFLRHLSGRRRPLLDGIACRIEGLIADSEGRTTDATALLRRSVGLLLSAGFPSETAQSLLDLGRHLHGARKRAEANETFTRASEIARAAGDEQLVDMVTRAQSTTGSQTIRNLLSDREQIIADEAAQGLTNREIAESHFLSVRTVETQLSSAYRKLGVRSRSELTVLLSRERAS
jgi:DNA-binding CsgD family transcriptional regulator